MLTAPSEEQKWNPTHAYTLRGVANSTDTFFVCLRAEPDLMEIDDGKSASTPAEQWWKLGYVADDEEPVKAQVRESHYLTSVAHQANLGCRSLRTKRPWRKRVESAASPS